MFTDMLEEDDQPLKMADISRSPVNEPRTGVCSTPLLQHSLHKHRLEFTSTSLDSGFSEYTFSTNSELSQRSSHFMSEISQRCESLASDLASSSVLSPGEEWLDTSNKNCPDYPLSPFREMTVLQARRLTFEPKELQYYFPDSSPLTETAVGSFNVDANADVNLPDSEFETHDEIQIPSCSKPSSESSSPLSCSTMDLEVSLQEMSLDEISTSSGSRSSPCSFKRIDFHVSTSSTQSSEDLSSGLPSFAPGSSLNSLTCYHKAPDLTVDSNHWLSLQTSVMLPKDRRHKTLSAKSSQLQKVIDHFSPPEPSRLIGRNVGLKHFDIIQNLRFNFPFILQRIFELLSPTDLSSLCKVNKQWAGCVRSDRKAGRRLRMFLDQPKPVLKELTDKENEKRKNKEVNHRPTLTCSKGLLMEVQAQAITTCTEQPTATNISLPCCTVLHDDEFRKCPRCQYSALIKPGQERAVCMNAKCAYDFCTSCFAAFHHPKKCIPLHKMASTTGLAGTKKSKKNLKRL